jgi:hypothetical protein
MLIWVQWQIDPITYKVTPVFTNVDGSQPVPLIATQGTHGGWLYVTGTQFLEYNFGMITVVCHLLANCSNSHDSILSSGSRLCLDAVFIEVTGGWRDALHDLACLCLGLCLLALHSFLITVVPLGILDDAIILTVVCAVILESNITCGCSMVVGFARACTQTQRRHECAYDRGRISLCVWKMNTSTKRFEKLKPAPAVCMTTPKSNVRYAR